ncbi:3-oxoacyl-[acyl-carrier-protein] reductase [candidate division WOR-3 bacterium]|nr:3-oxoacyl-[acyl-carrier-protein] reductase [candidate division WOR-3 bacterium]
MLLRGNVALITGGASGIGAGIARRFIKEGAVVILGDVDAQAGQATAQDLGDHALFSTLDISNEDNVNAVVKGVFNEHGKIDILINNAGITNDRLLLRMTKEDWQRVIDINLTGTFLVTRAVMKYMIKQRYGRITNIASIVGLIGNPGQANYSASKAGIIGFTKACAKELAGRSITVNAIAPGFIDTRMTDALSDEIKEQYKQAIPVKRFGTVDDVASLAAYLSSQEASYITGQIICVDGGMVM